VPDDQLRATIQTNIKTIIQAVTGIENVFVDAISLVRAQQPQEFYDDFIEADGSDLQAWFIGRRRTPTDDSVTSRDVALRTRLHRRHNFDIVGYYGFKEKTSEPVFQTLIDNVITAFNNEGSLGAFDRRPIQLDNIDLGYLGDVFCHRAHFSIEVTEIVSGLAPA
jgi:hypothetical protein